MSSVADRDSILPAYEDIRNDSTDTKWATFVYDGDAGKTVALGMTGTDYSEFLQCLKDDNRVYGYVRFETGDEMSRRAKFSFITWIGKNVTPLKKAKVSTDKGFVKQLCTNFGKEILADDIEQLEESKMITLLTKASGSSYGTGVRD